jgi:hypothetical protein
MNDDSLVTPTLPDGAIPPDKGGTDTTGEPSVEIMKGIDYLLGLMQGTAPFGSDVSRFFPNAKEDN